MRDLDGLILCLNCLVHFMTATISHAFIICSTYLLSSRF